MKNYCEILNFNTKYGIYEYAPCKHKFAVALKQLVLALSDTQCEYYSLTGKFMVAVCVLCYIIYHINYIVCV